jgi:hypothetical protein
VNLNCGGIPGIQCRDDPHLEASSVIRGGYFDLPCAGEPPTGCATPLPGITPEALADSMPLILGRLDIPVDHVGRYEVPLGEARLPNGRLTAARFALVEPWPKGVSILDGGVGLEVRSIDDGGKPIGNVYEHGWYPGAERVEAVLVFNVSHFDPGATLGIMDIVVQ